MPFTKRQKKLNSTKLKVFADDKKMAKILLSVFDSLGNIVEKGENAAYQLLFSFFAQSFKIDNHKGHYNPGLCCK